MVMEGTMKGRVVAMVTLFVGASSVWAWSQVPAGGEFQVNTYTTNWQYESSVAADAAGNFVVAWTGNAQDGGGAGVYAQRYDALGTPRGGEFRVNTHTTDPQTWPSVAMSWAGDFVVTWSSMWQDGDDWGIFAQRFAASGARLGE